MLEKTLETSSGVIHYWINEKLLKFELNGHSINIAPAILEIIRAYIEAKQHSFNIELSRKKV